MHIPLPGFRLICSLDFKTTFVTVDKDGAGRQNHSLRSFILAPNPATSYVQTLPATVYDREFMNKITFLILTFGLFTSCVQRTTEQTSENPDSTIVSITTDKVDNSVNMFADSCFTFLALDSLNEHMLRDSVDSGKKYISSVKRFKKEHCRFFRTGCTNSFWDEYVFLVSKQKPIHGILPIIIHDSKDFDYYHCDLFTLDKNYKKVDSLRVSLHGYSRDGDEIKYSTIQEKKSIFSEDRITTIEFKYNKFDNDSTVTVDSTIFYRKIDKDGRIRLIKKEKLI